jgi:hypothetical protein
VKANGSVLIVVLGLLAILAVVGITFVTMSSIDRSTSSNFALQTQFDFAADAGVEYACDRMVKDLWELKDRSLGTYGRLMSGPSFMLATPKAYNCDWPGAELTTSTNIGDDWLCSPIDPEHLTPTWWSFKGSFPTVTTPYGLPATVFSNTSMPTGNDMADNLAVGTSNGIWIPDLMFPYEGGLVRVSLTILDNNGMINLNAHGNSGANTPRWPAADAYGRGYYISDVDPSAPGQLTTTTLNTSTNPPGRWGQAQRPAGNNGEIYQENPSIAYTDTSSGTRYYNAPFTLDEEFELRRMTDSPYNSRLKQLGNGAFTPAKNRLLYTTYGMTSLALSDGYANAHVSYAPSNDGQSASAVTGAGRKVDLNRDNIGGFYSALRDARAIPVCPQTSGDIWVSQFLANIIGFRDGATGWGIKSYNLGGGSGGGVNAVAASRQPIISKIKAESTSGGYTINVQIISPWKNDTAMDAQDAGLTVSGMTLTGTVVATANCSTTTFSARMTGQVPVMASLTVTTTASNINTVLTSVQLNYAGKVLDRWSKAEDEQAGKDAGAPSVPNLTDGRYRPIYWEEEKRGNSDPSPVLVVYVGRFMPIVGGGDASTFTLAPSKNATSGIPIRFPRSVDGNSSNLPPRATEQGRPFKSFARVGDLDQVLCFSSAGQNSGNFWPWLVPVANAKPATDDSEEKKYKWDWKNDDGMLGVGNFPYARALAANVLTVGGPWKDGLDNDGDGKTDDQDLGTADSSDSGRFNGPELRVAGLINLNTATPQTLDAMESVRGLDVHGLKQKVLDLRGSGAILSPAVLLPDLSVGTSYAKGPIETRDEGFCRISNIATIRSDTFSVYGTVQFGTLSKVGAANTYNVVRSRRFWALVDRSPSLAFMPATTLPGSSPQFIPPRILNFQWLN